MRVRRHLAAALVPIAASAAALSATWPAQAADPAPSVVITNPTGQYAGDQNVYVDATGTGTSADLPQSFALVVDADTANPVSQIGCQSHPTPTSCTGELSWSPGAALDGTQHSLQVILTTVGGSTAASAVTTVTIVSPTVPTLSVSQPPVAADATGTVPVTVTATMDASKGDAGRNMVLFFRDGIWDDNADHWCPPPGAADTCTFTFDVPAQDVIDAAYSIWFNSQQSGARTGAAPVVFLTAPADGSVTSGTIQVDATATVDTAYGDRAQFLQLVVDGVPTGATAGCPQPWPGYGPQTCQVSLPWNASGVAPGKHTVAVAITTLQSSGVSVASHVTVPGDVEVTLTGHDYEERGQFTSLNGFAVSTLPPHGGVAGIPVDVTFTPYVGAPRTVHVVTTEGGAYTVTSPTPLTSNTVVTAKAGGSTASATVLVRVPISCVVPSTVADGKQVTIACHADFLAYRSVVALRIAGGSVPHAVQFAKTDKHGNVSYTLTFVHPNQQLQVRATTATTRTYGASTSPTYALRVS